MTKTCNRCGLTQPINEFALQPQMRCGRRNQCKTCGNADRAKRRSDPKKLRAELDCENKRRRNDPRHREKHRLNMKEWRDANKERLRATRQRYYAKKLKSRRILLTDSEKRENARASLRRHWKNNRQEYRTRTLNYIARKRGAAGFHTDSDVAFMLEYQKFRCFWCDCDISTRHHIDHLIPLSKHGGNGPDNIVGSCDPCNRSKGAKLPEEFLAYRIERGLFCAPVFVQGVPANSPPATNPE